MERLTTDTPETNMEVLANFAYAKDKEVHLIYGDGLDDVALADYIVDHAKSDFGCSVTREDVINGDSCWECDCPLAILNATATQAAELRSRLKKYEDAEEAGKLIMLPFGAGKEIFSIRYGEVETGTVWQVEVNSYTSPAIWIRYTIHSKGLGKLEGHTRIDLAARDGIYFTREEAEAALKGERNETTHL